MSDEAIAAQPERGRFDATDRRALRAVALQFFVNGALFASVMPRLPEIRDRVEVSITTIGVLLSLAGLSGLVGSAVVGSAIARFGTRTVIIFSATMMALSVALVGVARAPGLLLVGLIGLSTFDVLVDVGMNMQGSWLSARRHAPVMNRLHGLWSLGTLIGGLTSARVAAAGVSLSTHLVVAAAVLALVVVQVGRGVLRIDEAPSAAAGTPAISTPGPGRRRAWPRP
ncbi:MAG: MFS transporter, partial [Actinomycetota bacterium]